MGITLSENGHDTDPGAELSAREQRRLERSYHRTVEHFAQRRHARVAEAADDDRVGRLGASAERCEHRRDAGELLRRALNRQRPTGAVSHVDDRVRAAPVLKQPAPAIDLGSPEWTGRHVTGNLIEDTHRPLLLAHTDI